MKSRNSFGILNNFIYYRTDRINITPLPYLYNNIYYMGNMEISLVSHVLFIYFPLLPLGISE